MCGRYGGPRELEVHAGFLDVPPPFANKRSYELIRPTDMAPVFARSGNGNVVIKEMRWWLVPASHRGTVREWTNTTFNARLDDIERKPTFSRAWNLKRRVLVPADHYYESSKTSPLKQTWRIAARGNTPMAFAGIWDYANTADGALLSFAILTREPGDTMRRFHPREPVVIAPSHWQAWLNGDDMPALSQSWSEDAFSIVVA
ncbi:SOS response-associated peptidase [Asticcacaulis sp. YBE204]|uniref:SOS response-associated peptidase n=1 Tax=Asticcacaulis sp. YBE204 TaxID=1282363 RepID=UPI0003C3CE04|nr:SOS response-associated peptidase family protein [Asticcacaulis sp. YBE204]ESQ79311.1 hypothetical protein AEYBE204_09895 [Asticcacaulis sp. YBE204]